MSFKTLNEVYRSASPSSDRLWFDFKYLNNYIELTEINDNQLDLIIVFDNYNKITEKSYNYVRNIIKNNSTYKVLKVNKNYDTFIFEYNDVKNGIDKNSFFYETFNLVAKEENGVTGQFGGEELEIYFNKNNSVIKKIFKDFYKKSYSNEESPIKDWENIIFYSNEKELEKYFLKNEEKEISTSDYEKINMMEEFRNGY
jgi:hypothetical protein